ncbi:MAG: tRNA 4-thiouridine(8) synthase ThiI [Candidatus Marsarchaeota archaeon]|nr:tRNA 4-thiouridine(8) synthase ThiI [Candidatus Marsarchaeota archaeon]
MDECNAVIIHFGELWLKGKNRNYFINSLFKNIELAINKNNDDKYKIEKLYDRFLIYLSSNQNKENIDYLILKLKHIFGISWFAPCFMAENKFENILESANELLKKQDSAFKIIAHRSYKKLEFNSRQIINYFISNQQKLKFRIDLNADKILYINPTQYGCFIFSEKINGLKGLPVGVSGNAVVLFSGGIDSPVASFYAMKRGLKVVYIHVHAFAKNEEAVESQKIRKLIEQLNKYSNSLTMYYLPSYFFQAATMKIPKKYEHVLFKRFLFKLAEKIAEIEKANVIVTGESLGQVSSQTTTNLIASEPDDDLLIMRPLVGFDKQEIINKAKQINTYNYSLLKYRDVCSIIVKNPSTNIKKDLINKLYKNTKLTYVINRTLKKAKCIKYLQNKQ